MDVVEKWVSVTTTLTAPLALEYLCVLFPPFSFPARSRVWFPMAITSRDDGTKYSDFVKLQAPGGQGSRECG